LGHAEAIIAGAGRGGRGLGASQRDLRRAVNPEFVDFFAI
jgi:hypothetical protein